MSSTTHQYIVDLINNNFNVNKKLSILDYGCGDGHLLKFLSQRRIKKYQGFDINSASLATARSRYSGNKISFHIIDKKKPLQLGKKNSFNLVTCVGVLQYLSPRELNNFLQQIQKVLKKDGAIVVSCAADHRIYRYLNLYSLFLPHSYLSRTKLIYKLKSCGFKIIHSQEKGLVLAPFFSNIVVFFFDAADRLFRNRSGSLGPLGKLARKSFAPLLSLEARVPLDYGYTLYLVAKLTKITS